MRRDEVMIHVYWSASGDARDAREGGRGHLLQRDKVIASLGLDAAPDPGFTPAEMQLIASAAKLEAVRCLGRRRTPERVDAQVLELIGDTPQPAADIHARLVRLSTFADLSPRDVSRALCRLRRVGRVMLTGRGSTAAWGPA